MKKYVLLVLSMILLTISCGKDATAKRMFEEHMKIIQSGLLPDGTLLDNDRLLVVSIGNASLLIPELKSYFLI